MNEIKKDFDKGMQHNPHYWLLMTSRISPPEINEWIKSIEEDDTYKTKIRIIRGAELNETLMKKPHLASKFIYIFNDYNKEVSAITDLMGQGKYSEALSRILSSKFYELVPRCAYLEACCRSMLSEKSSDGGQENIEKGFKALKTAIDKGYIEQTMQERNWPRRKTIDSIDTDRELNCLKQKDDSIFKELVKDGGGGGCLVSSTTIRLTTGITKPISMINIGDSVLIANEHAKSAIVQDKFCKKENWLVCINNKITVSQSQRFLTTQGFKKGSGSKQDDMLMTFNGLEPVITINHLHTPMDVHMINLSSGHLFYAEDFIVHNVKYLMKDVISLVRGSSSLSFLYLPINYHNSLRSS